MLVLLAIPAVVFIVPAALGHPAIAGDNIIQNFPLRAYTGELLRHGQLPLWNPYIWSGSPLLAGLNAGSAYPFTWFFVFLPALVAWVVNLLVVYWAGAIGCYALARYYRLDPLPSALGAGVYAFSGAMAGQMVHIGIVQGMGWMPWMVLAELGLSRAALGLAPREEPLGPSARGGLLARLEGWSPWPWTVILTGALTLVLLTGEPRSMAEAEIVASVTALWVLLRPYRGLAAAPPSARRRLRLVGFFVLAAGWAAALSAFQMLPGWSFISGSQRASESLSFFGSGSLLPSWSALLLVPDLFGGDGILHQPGFFNQYNLPEVTGYVGLLPLAAALALLTRSFGRRRDRGSSEWGLWLVLLVFGLLASWGTYTPLGTFFGHIPLFDKLRLQSRNLGIVDFALAVLLAFWAQRALGKDVGRAGLTGWRRYVTAAPIVAAVALLVVGLAIPGPMERAFTVAAHAAYLGRYLTPWFIASLVVALGALALVIGWRRLTPRGRRRALCAVVVIDVALFNLSSSTGLSSGHATVEPNRATAVSVLGARGRTAFVQPRADFDTLSEVGEPDLNVFTKVPSVQGYGSILTGTYGDVTGTHLLDTLDGCALAQGVFRPLRLATILTTTGSLLVAEPTDGAQPPAPAPCPGAPAPGRPGARTWYLGGPLTITSAVLEPVSGRAGTLLGHEVPRVGVLTASGATIFPAVRLRRTADEGWAVRFAVPQSAVGLVVHGPARLISDTSTVTTSAAKRYLLDGPMQDALGQRGWRFTGTWRYFSRFEAASVMPPVWVAGSAHGATVTRVQSQTSGEEVDQVRSDHRVLVVRSEAASAGWTVHAVPTGGGPARDLPVKSVGLVQGVWVPAGHWTLTFRYWPPRLTLGLALSALGAAAMVAALFVWLVRRRRRRRVPAGFAALGGDGARQDGG